MGSRFRSEVLYGCFTTVSKESFVGMFLLKASTLNNMLCLIYSTVTRSLEPDASVHRRGKDNRLRLRCAPGSLLCLCIDSTRKALESAKVQKLLTEAYALAVSSSQRMGTDSKAGHFSYEIGSLKINLATQDMGLTWGEVRSILRTLDGYMRRHGYAEVYLEIFKGRKLTGAWGHILDPTHH